MGSSLASKQITFQWVSKNSLCKRNREVFEANRDFLGKATGIPAGKTGRLRNRGRRRGAYAKPFEPASWNHRQDLIPFFRESILPRMSVLWPKNCADSIAMRTTPASTRTVCPLPAMNMHQRFGHRYSGCRKRRRADFVVDSSQGFDHTRGADSRHFANYRYNATPVILKRRPRRAMPAAESPRRCREPR